jgi:NADPH:quinone reductase-like Zn-dependent oxidoreductase
MTIDTTTAEMAQTDTTTGATSPAISPTEVPTTMSAVSRHRYGTPETVIIEQAAVPQPGPTEVLVEVAAAGLDRGVWHLLTGRPYLLRLAGFGVRRPKQPVLGGDVAGRVAAVGSSVTRFAPGDHVMGVAGGSFADYAVADESTLAIKPDSITFDEAAASPISGITALQALTTVGGVEAGQHVLIIGASGGVGSFAVQIAKALGARVTGVASTAKLDFVTSLGADAVIDHTTTDLRDLAEQFDVIIDIAGRTPLRHLRRLLTDHGTHVIVGGDNGGRFAAGTGRNLRAVVLSVFVPQRMTFFVSSGGREHLDPLVEMLAERSVVPAIDQRMSLDDAVDAIRALDAGRTRGKNVLVVESIT